MPSLFYAEIFSRMEFYYHCSYRLCIRDWSFHLDLTYRCTDSRMHIGLLWSGISVRVWELLMQIVAPTASRRSHQNANNWQMWAWSPQSSISATFSRRISKQLYQNIVSLDYTFREQIVHEISLQIFMMLHESLLRQPHWTLFLLDRPWAFQVSQKLEKGA